MKNDPTISISLTHDQALVLFDWLNKNQITAPVIDRIMWSVEATLEKALVEPFQTDYESHVAEALKRLSSV